MWNWIGTQYLRIFMVFWCLTAVGASVMHLFTAEYLVSLTSWQFAHNWQMEIAFFDLAWVGFIAYAFQKHDLALLRQIAVVLGVLSILLGTNHLSGFFIEHKSLHLIFAALNYLCSFSAILVLIAAKRMTA